MTIIGDGDVSYNLDFRSTRDDAWYTAGVVFDDDDGKQLRLKLKDFQQTSYDEVFSVSQFSSHEAVAEFSGRFRPVAIPVEDNECSRIIEGITVCATYKGDGSVRFFDAIVDDVHYKEHSPEKCLCTYVLFWQHGPEEGNITTASVEDICLLMAGPVDSRVARFTDLAKEKLKEASSPSSLISGRMSSHNGSTRSTKSPFSRKTNSNSPLHKLKEADSAGTSVLVGFSEGRGRFYHLQSDPDIDVGGVKDTGCHHYILLENLEKDLSPSLVMDFIHEQTSITAQAYVFPSLSAETYARGAIVLDSKPKLKRIYDFINNPNHFVVSLTGRPWVIVETGTSRVDLGSLQPKSQDIDVRCKLKVVCSGTDEYMRAKQLKDLFMEFHNHLNGLRKRLHMEEKKNWHLTPAN